jgi:hypothetical protein
MAYFYVPKKKELAQGFTQDNWRMVHFLPTAEYYEKEAGYPRGKLPSYRRYCPYRDDDCTVCVDSLGQVWTVDDQEVIDMYH